MSNELTHYGVLGMRWGRRKGTTSSQDKTSDDHKRKVSLKKKKLSELTNAELRELTNRMQLEKQYKDLNRSNVSAGRKVVKDIVGGAAKQTASNYISKYMSKGIDALINNTKK